MGVPPPKATQFWRTAQGVLLLVAVAVIWVAAGQLVQSLYKQDIRLPVFLTYVNNSEFVVLLPMQLLWERGRRASRTRRTSWRAAARAGLFVCPLWFLAQGSYNWSLSGTSVSSSTVLSTTSCVFTFFLSIIFLKEAFRWSRFIGVAITLAGATMVSLSDQESAAEGNRWWGDALALFSAFMYGVYTTAIRVMVPDEGEISMWAFFGFLGLFNCLLLSPVVAVLLATGVESLSGVSFKVILLLLAKGLFDNVLSDLLWARAIQLTSPTVATVALSLTIPVAMLSDLLLNGILPAPLLLAGSALVAAGFVLCTVSLDGEPRHEAVAEGAGSEETETVGLSPAGPEADACPREDVVAGC